MYVGLRSAYKTNGPLYGLGDDLSYGDLSPDASSVSDPAAVDPSSAPADASGGNWLSSFLGFGTAAVGAAGTGYSAYEKAQASISNSQAQLNALLHPQAASAPAIGGGTSILLVALGAAAVIGIVIVATKRRR